MRNILILITLYGLLAACTDNSSSRIREEVIASVENFVKNELGNPNRSVDDDGTIILFSNGIIYRIDPGRIVTGDLDGDSREDAIISLLVSRMPIMDRPEHMILLKDDSGFIITKVPDSDMKVLRIEDGIVYAEISVISPDSPMYGCDSCKEVVQFQYTGGDLIRIDLPVSP